MRLPLLRSHAAPRFDARVLRPSRSGLIPGLLLFAVTYPLIPLATVCLPYYSQHGGLRVLLDIRGLSAVLPIWQTCYFLPGLGLALIFFGCLRLWLRQRSRMSGWLKSACLVSLAVAVFETAALFCFFTDGDIPSGLTRDALGLWVSLVVGLFISGVAGAYCWTEPSRTASG